MQVRLVAITQPVGLEKLGIETAGQLIAYCARVSNPANQGNVETAPRLLAYLVRHGHWSPFEMVSMTMEIIAPRDVTRQIIRHRSFSFQEFSQRYATPRPSSLRTARVQGAKSRQGSVPTDDREIVDWWNMKQEVIHRAARAIYSEAVEKGIAYEVARAILPEGLTESVLYMAGTIRSWIHYCQLRTKPDTQAEHREIALAVEKILIGQFPEIEGILNDGQTQA